MSIVFVILFYSLSFFCGLCGGRKMFSLQGVVVLSRGLNVTMSVIRANTSFSIMILFDVYDSTLSCAQKESYHHEN